MMLPTGLYESKAINQQWLIVHARAARPHAEEIDCSLQNTDVVRKFVVKGFKKDCVTRQRHVVNRSMRSPPPQNLQIGPTILHQPLEGSISSYNY